MGYMVLYIAFGVVALWLLGEVLLQYKARLRWRLLAFAGFLGVVVGVVMPSVVVICAGAAAFATGQTFVTLSYRRGFSTGWAIGGKPGTSGRRRKSGSQAAATAQPTLEVSGVEPVPETPDGVAGIGSVGDEDAEDLHVFGAGYDEGTDQSADRTQVYSPMPLHEDTGEYGIYSDRSSYVPDPYTSGGYEGYGAQGYGSDWQEQQQQQPAAAYAYDAQSYQMPGDQGYADPYQGYGYGQQQYPEYQETPYQDPYAAQYGYEAAPGGVWTPQEPAAHPGEQPHIPPQPPPADPYQQQPYEHYEQQHEPYRY